MPTEREVLLQIMRDDPEGIPNLFDRHASLFREGLLRFFGGADEAQVPLLLEMIRAMAADLKAGKFDDLVETFYDWVVRDAWGSFMRIKMEQAGGEHIEPDLIYECSDRPNEAALTEEVRQRCRSHFEACELCRDLLDKCKNVEVEIRHAGAAYPEEFQTVIQKTLGSL
ncbi:MAG: hypothetical protein ACYTG7_10985 [Planctomycetota bacterium]|jgi:hypothetical protein